MSMLLFTDATLLDCTGRDPAYPAWVLSEDGIIKETGSGKAPGLSGAEAVDCRGKTLMPGLIDGHIHASLFTNDLGDLHRKFLPSMGCFMAAKILEDTLYQGFTTVRDAGGADAGFREAQKQGLIVAPRMQVCGRVLSMTGGHADVRLPTEIGPCIDGGMLGVIADGVDEVRKAAREQLRRGADYIKVMAGGGCASPSDEPDTVQYSPEELAAIVYEAKAAGKTVLSHNYSNRSMKACAEAGVHSIEHGNYLDRETARLLKEKGCWLVPTMATYDIMARRGEEFGIPSYFLRKMKEVQKHSENALAIAFEEGLKIGSGSDVVGSGQPYKALEVELKARIMGPMKAILCTTKDNAELMGISEKVGTIEPGKYADFLVIDGDPLKDVTVFQNRDKILAIVQGGKFFKKKL